MGLTGSREIREIRTMEIRKSSLREVAALVLEGDSQCFGRYST